MQTTQSVSMSSAKSYSSLARLHINCIVTTVSTFVNGSEDLYIGFQFIKTQPRNGPNCNNTVFVTLMFAEKELLQ